MNSSEYVFYNKLNDECLHLLIETRDYLQFRSRIDQQYMTAQQRLLMTCLAMRLTAQLTDVMAWILQKKAEYTGDASPQINERYDWNSIPEVNLDNAVVPQELEGLMSRSDSLFERAQRLAGTSLKNYNAVH